LGGEVSETGWGDFFMGTADWQMQKAHRNE